jgi:anti-sigma-K factor RskA
VSDNDVHHLAAAYALDAVDEHERALFEAHYRSCDICRVDVVEFRETLALLSAADTSMPPPSVKDHVMAEIARTRQLSPVVRHRRAVEERVIEERVGDVEADDVLAARRTRRTTAMLLAAAAVVGVLAAGAIVLDRDTAPSYASALAEVLDQPDGRVVDLEPTDGGSGADVRVAWSETAGRAVLLADGLSEAPDGSAYELWLIEADGPAAMHVLDSAADGAIRDVMDLETDPVAWGVTIEPEAGSPVPTGEVIFLADA